MLLLSRADADHIASALPLRERKKGWSSVMDNVLENRLVIRIVGVAIAAAVVAAAAAPLVMMAAKVMA